MQANSWQACAGVPVQQMRMLGLVTASTAWLSPWTRIVARPGSPSALATSWLLVTSVLLAPSPLTIWAAAPPWDDPGGAVHSSSASATHACPRCVTGRMVPRLTSEASLCQRCATSAHAGKAVVVRTAASLVCAGAASSKLSDIDGVSSGSSALEVSEEHNVNARNTRQW